jgi:hypothetical protein
MLTSYVIPAKAGIHATPSDVLIPNRALDAAMDSRLRGNDGFFDVNQAYVAQ